MDHMDRSLEKHHVISHYISFFLLLRLKILQTAVFHQLDTRVKVMQSRVTVHIRWTCGVSKKLGSDFVEQ